MGKILFRYIIREIISPFVLAVFIFTFVIFMFQILKLADWVVNYGVGLVEIGKFLAYLLPPLMVFTVPMAFLLAVMLAINRLSGDSELIAMKASGISLYQMIPPVMTLSIIAMLITFSFTLYAEPWGKQAIRKHLVALGKSKANLGINELISERVFSTNLGNFVIYVDRFAEGSDKLEGVFIADERNEQAPNIIVAPEGRLLQNTKNGLTVIRLFNGSMHRTMPDPEAYETAYFGTYDIILDVDSVLKKKSSFLIYHEMYMGQLSENIKKLRQKEGDTFNMRRSWVEYHRRLAFPFICIIFGLVGLPLGIAPPRSGKSRGFSLAIFVICIYYLLFRTGESIGWKGIAHPIVVMWAPNVLFAVLGTVLIHKKANETPIRSIEFLAYQYEKASMFIARKFFGEAIRNNDEEPEE